MNNQNNNNNNTYNSNEKLLKSLANNSTIQGIVEEEERVKTANNHEIAVQNQYNILTNGTYKNFVGNILQASGIPLPTNDQIQHAQHDPEIANAFINEYGLNLIPTTPTSERIVYDINQYDLNIKYLENQLTKLQNSKATSQEEGKSIKSGIEDIKDQIAQNQKQKARLQANFLETESNAAWKTKRAYEKNNQSSDTAQEEEIKGNILKSAADIQTDQKFMDFAYNMISTLVPDGGYRQSNKSAPLYNGEDILGASGQANIIKSLIDKKNNTKDATMSDKDIRNQVQEAMKDTNIQALARLAVRQNLVKSSEDFINLLFHNPTFVEANIWGKAFGDYKNYGIGYKFMSKGVDDLIKGINSEEANYIANLFFDNSPQGRANIGATLELYRAK